MKFTLEEKLGYLNLIVERCDRLAQKHTDFIGCSMQCRQLAQAIENDLRMADAIETFDSENMN